MTSCKPQNKNFQHKTKEYKYNTKGVVKSQEERTKEERNRQELQNNQKTIKMAIRANLSIITKEYLHGFR